MKRIVKISEYADYIKKIHVKGESPTRYEFDPEEVSQELRVAAQWINSHIGSIKRDYRGSFEENDHWGLPEGEVTKEKGFETGFLLTDNEINFIFEQTAKLGTELEQKAKDNAQALYKEIEEFIEDAESTEIGFDINLSVLGFSSDFHVYINLTMWVNLGRFTLSPYLGSVDMSNVGSKKKDVGSSIETNIADVMNNVIDCSDFEVLLANGCDAFGEIIDRIRAYEKQISKLHPDEYTYFVNI